MIPEKGKFIAIDLVPIRPGKGGTGSGIWTVARELVNHLDRLDDSHGLRRVCLINREQQPFFTSLRNIRCLVFPDFGKNIFSRLLWVHLLLPVWCLVRRVDVLHKLATETPLFCSAQRVTTVHDFFHEFMREQGASIGPADCYFHWMSSVCFRKSAAVIAVSDATRSEAARRFPGSRAVLTTLYNGVLPPHDPPAILAESRPFTVLYVAKLMPYKGQIEALHAFRKLLEKHSELSGRVRLVFRGFSNDAEYVLRLEKEMRSGLAAGRAELRAYSAENTLDDIYKSADLLLFLSQYEGFGLPVIEAQARGIPVVCSDIPVLREVGGEAALYVNRADPDAVASVLYELIEDESVRSRLIWAGLKNAKRFDWETTAQETQAVYLACATAQKRMNL